MSKSDSLFKLIRSLNGTEKAYFKKIAGAFSDSAKNNAVQLFDIIEQQEAYDELKVVEEMNDKNYTHNLSRHKNYLFELVLHSQYNYNLKWSKPTEISHLARCVELLIEKQHYKEADKMIRSLKKQAHEFEIFLQLHALISLQRKIPSRYHGIPFDGLELLKEQQNALHMLNNNIQYEYLMQQVIVLWGKINESKSKDDLGELKNFLEGPYLKNEKVAFSTKAKLNYNTILGGSYFVLGNLPKSYSYAMRIIRLFQEKKQMIKLDPEGYLDSIYNLFVTQAELYRFEEMFITMKDFFTYAEEPVIKKSNYLQGRIFEFSNFLYLTFYTRIGEYKRSLEKCENVKANIVKYKISPSYEVRLYYEMAYCYFITLNYKEALRCLNKIIFQNLLSEVVTIYSARVLSLLTHFELGNHAVLKSQLKIINEKSKSSKNYLSFVVDFIEKDVKKTFTPNEYKTALKSVYEETNGLINSDKEIKKMSVILDVLSWLESKIQKRPMKDIVKERALKEYGKINLPD